MYKFCSLGGGGQGVGIERQRSCCAGIQSFPPDNGISLFSIFSAAIQNFDVKYFLSHFCICF